MAGTWDGPPRVTVVTGCEEVRMGGYVVRRMATENFKVT